MAISSLGASTGLAEAGAATGVTALTVLDVPPPFGSTSAIGGWIAESFARAPALLLGLAAVAFVPILALLGRLARRRNSDVGDDADADALTYVHTRKRGASDLQGDAVGRTERGPAWPSDGWLEVEGGPDPRRPIGRSIIRIGREADNDICFADKSVHRYHAAVHRTDDAEYVITDLSSAGGNGITVNGRRMTEARLRDGDLIQLGAARLRFRASPA